MWTSNNTFYSLHELKQVMNVINMELIFSFTAIGVIISLSLEI